jgi:hypothetical protein
MSESEQLNKIVAESSARHFGSGFTSPPMPESFGSSGAGIGGRLSDPPAGQAVREMNLTERVMTHDQRIAQLEAKYNGLVVGLEQVLSQLQRQLGVKFE